MTKAQNKNKKIKSWKHIRDRSFIGNYVAEGGGGGGAVVLEGGYDFQNHLKEGGTFLFPILSGGGGGYIFLRLVFSKSGVAGVSVCSTSDITQKMP